VLQNPDVVFKEFLLSLELFVTFWFKPKSLLKMLVFQIKISNTELPAENQSRFIRQTTYFDKLSTSEAVGRVLQGFEKCYWANMQVGYFCFNLKVAFLQRLVTLL
jgi:hypothetical protein